MKKFFSIKFLPLFLLSLLAFSCLDDDSGYNPNLYIADTFSSLSDFVENVKPEAQTFSIDPTILQTITGENGTEITIPPGAFTDDNNNPITTTITASLKEYLNVKSMFFGNVQTVSNGSLLVTGGSFELIFKDENGNDVNANPWNIRSKIPVETDITGYENDMQYFVGTTNNVDGREVVNCTQGQPEFWMDDNGFFNILGVQQGLSNCDVLYDMAGETATQFEVIIPGVTDYTEAIVWMFIEDFPSIVMIYSLNEVEDALTTYQNSIPEGLNATLVAITVDEDNYLKFGNLPITVQGDDTFVVDVDYGTTEELSELIDFILD